MQRTSWESQQRLESGLLTQLPLCLTTQVPVRLEPHIHKVMYDAVNRPSRPSNSIQHSTVTVLPPFVQANDAEEATTVVTVTIAALAMA